LIQPASQCSRQYAVIAPHLIHYLRFILEAYEGSAMVTTLDASLGLIQLSIAPGCEDEINLVLAAESANLRLRPVRPPQGADASFI
jgi:hypothetical protein